MIFENFFFLSNIYLWSFTLCTIILLTMFFNQTNTRKKFILFIFIFTLYIFIGLFYQLDGIIMLFAVSELSVLLIFITLFSQLYNFTKKNTKTSNLILIFYVFILNYFYYDLNIINYNNYYSFFNINLNDFYFIYNYYFEKQILLSILIIFIITLYSIFFILLYFNLKKSQNFNLTKNSNINLLRKQNITHQSNYQTKIRTFQK